MFEAVDAEMLGSEAGVRGHLIPAPQCAPTGRSLQFVVMILGTRIPTPCRPIRHDSRRRKAARCMIAFGCIVVSSGVSSVNDRRCAARDGITLRTYACGYMLWRISRCGPVMMIGK